MITHSTESGILLLGVAARAVSHPPFVDLFQGGYSLPLSYYPQQLGSTSLVMAANWKQMAARGKSTFVIVIRGVNRYQSISLEWQEIESEDPDVAEEIAQRTLLRAPPAGGAPTSMRFLYGLSQQWSLLTVPMPSLVVTEPCTVDVYFQTESESIYLGNFECAFAPQPPLSEGERAALMARADAFESIALTLRCGKCKESFGVWESLSGNYSRPPPAPEIQPLHSAPASWKCGCGLTSLDMKYLKRNTAALFRQSRSSLAASGLEPASMVTRAQLAKKRLELERIISEGAREEVLQNAIESHPAVWTFLSPSRILHKPDIIGKFKADFAVLGSNGILYFVEIEKPQTKLCRKNGGQAAELQVAIDQIHDWRELVRNHRGAVLQGLGFSDTSVVGEAYLVIAGRNANTPPAGLRKLRNSLQNEGAVKLFTYDDIIAFLMAMELALT